MNNHNKIKKSSFYESNIIIFKERKNNFFNNKNNIIPKEIITSSKLLKLSIIAIFLLLSISSVSGHILLVGDTNSDLTNERQELLSIYEKLIEDNYPVLLFVGENATAENIIKGMYGADAIIYVGHGSDLEYYKGDGGISKAPYALPSSDQVNIWTSYDVLSEGLDAFDLNYNGKFVPPIKKGASIFFIHTCFASGWVENSFVGNPDETIYKFNNPYIKAGANIYTTGFYQAYEGYFFGVLGQELANGGEESITFNEANDNLDLAEEVINTNNPKNYNNMTYYTNANYTSLFIGNLSSKVIPNVENCSEYDQEAANNWYNSGKSIDDPIYHDSIKSASSNFIYSYFDNLLTDFIAIFN